MSSHREAPQISKDPVADSTDVYAFVDPNDAELVTIIANYIPLQDPASGPNFFEFGGYTPTDPNNGVNPAPVTYDININNDGTGVPNVTYRFTFTVTIPNKTTFLYADYPISVQTQSAPGDPLYNLSGTGSGGWNRPQTYTIEKIVGGVATPLAEVNGNTLYCPPCNVGPRTTPNYGTLAAAAEYTLATREKVFAGQRADAFWVDLGSIFDLGDLRPLSSAQLIKGATTNGINPLADKNVHTIAIQVPIVDLVSGSGQPVIGVWTTANRPPMKMQNTNGTRTYSGNPVQVSRLGNPLVNEVVVPMALKDYFNASQPVNDSQFAAAVEDPELQNRLIELYPGAFPNLKAYIDGGGKRTDLVAVFATGIPGLTEQSTHPTVSEILRLNTSIAPVTPSDSGFSKFGVIGGDKGGFPNGRRVVDDVVTIELQAVGGATIPLVDPSYKPDAVLNTANPQAPGLDEKVPFNAAAVTPGYIFPYLNDPWPGFSNPTGTPANNNGSAGTDFVPTTTSS
jgi:hypothetical protein